MERELESKQFRIFGLSVGAALTLVGLWPLLLYGRSPRTWIMLCGLVSMLAALVVPRSLKPVHRGWMIVGEGVAWLVGRFSLILVYYGLIVPYGIGMRLFGRDPMNRKFEPAAESYRISRESRPASHMKHQF
jgi:hypothetical protein